MRNQARPSWIPVPALIAVLALVVAACGPAATSPGAGTPGGGSPGTGSPGAGTAEPTAGGGGGSITMLSTQLNPVAEAEKMQGTILANFEGDVQFVGAADTGTFNDQVRAQEQAGSGDISLLGGLHGEFSALGPDVLTDLSDIVGELGDVNSEYLELGKLGTDQQLFIPWMQNTYIMAARQEALEYLPEGADLNALTWQQVSDWGAAIEEDTGEKKLGFPAGTDGLWHRFFQGYGYPAFTGAVNTKFTSDEAVAMWQWLSDTWSTSVNPQSTTYAFMQEPLQSGDVWIAWDHAARLIEALRSSPGGSPGASPDGSPGASPGGTGGGIVAFPAPAGPAGRAFMPVLVGLAIPKSAADPDGAKELIKYLLQPDTQATTLSQVAFFPVITGELSGDLEPGTKAESDAITAMTSASDALPALLPVGLGDQGTAYNKVFRDAFQQIVLDGGDPATVLAERLPDLQAVFTASSAPCWSPDPPSDGACQPQ